MKKHIFAAALPIAVVVFLILLYVIISNHSSSVTPLNFSISVCSLEGDTISFEMDADLIDNFLDPVHYNGKVIFAGKEYTDHYHRFHLDDQNIFVRAAERWRLRKVKIPYNQFHYPSTGNFTEYIEVSVIPGKDAPDSYFVYIRYWDMKNKVHGDFFGPSENREKSMMIQSFFNQYYAG